MKTMRGLPRKAARERVLTLGVFDGLHRGHARILRFVRRIADRLKLPAAVLTFDDHPHGTLAPHKRPPRLATLEQGLTRLRSLGLDEVFLIRFTDALARTWAEDFVERTLVRRLRVRHLVIGQDFVFGRGGRGNSRLLRRLGRCLGFRVTVVPPLKQQGRTISSSEVRAMVARGDVQRAGQWLGWPYALHGRVVRGEGRGATIGLPTANLRTVHEIVPPPGTYAVRVRLRGHERPALCHIGKRPTFHPWGPETIEIHIPGWRGNLYNQRLEAAFLRRLRGERHFSGAHALLRQVAQDWRVAKQVWTKSRKPLKIHSL